jgi:hypothetical protein
MINIKDGFSSHHYMVMINWFCGKEKKSMAISLHLQKKFPKLIDVFLPQKIKNLQSTQTKKETEIDNMQCFYSP